MVGKIRKVKLKGSYVYPVTVSDAVYVANNKTLNQKIIELEGDTPSYLYGKKINALGDSLTAGAGGGVTPWTQIIANTYGCTVNNYGASGRRLSSTVGTAMVNMFNTMPDNADIITVWGGWNDINYGDTLPLGTMADRDNTTFYGSLHLLLDGLQTKYVGKKIVIFTVHNSSLDSSQTARLVSFNNAIREVADYYSVPVLDLHKNLGISYWNIATRNALMPDGIHPNTAGNTIVAEVIAKFLSSH